MCQCNEKQEDNTKTGRHSLYDANNFAIGIKKHESSACHKSAMEVMLALPSCCKYIGDQLSQLHADEKRDNHLHSLKILSNLWFMARQGVALGGNIMKIVSLL